MSVTPIFGMTVERIDDERVSIGIPDARGTYHHVELEWQAADYLGTQILMAVETQRHEQEGI
jgi:hypothetical protein